MDELYSDPRGNYTQCCWGFDAGTSNDIAFCGSSGQHSSLCLYLSFTHTHKHKHVCTCTHFGGSGQATRHSILSGTLSHSKELTRTVGPHPQLKRFICPVDEFLKFLFYSLCSLQTKMQFLPHSLIYRASACWRIKITSILITSLIYQALALAASLQLDHFILEGDSLVVALAIQNPSFIQDSRISPIISDIIDTIPASFSWEARNVNKSTNFYTHHAAQWATAKNAGHIPISPRSLHLNS